MSIQLTGDYAEIASRFSRKSGDINLYFRSKDFGKDALPGFKVEVCGDRFKNREFTSLEAALKYIERLHASHLRSK